MEQHIQTVKSWLGSGSINIFGDPFAGKDTQGTILAQYLNGVEVSGGQILREHPDQALAQQVMSAGGIVPSDIYLQLMLPFFAQPALEGKPLVLSSVGREHGEEPAIMQATSQSGHPIKAVLFIELPESEVWQRFEASQQLHDRGTRADDSREALAVRIEKFKTDTLPVIEYYREQDLLISINGHQPKEAVTTLIMERLTQHASSH